MTELKKYIRDGRAPIPKMELTSRIMSSIKGKDTKPELLLRKTLWNHGIKGYRIHWKKVPGKPDIAFPKKSIAIFVNGCFWHRCPYCNPSVPKSNSDFWINKFQLNIKRDEKKIFLLNQKGWQSLIVWECQLYENINIFIEKIKTMVNGTN